MVEICSLVNLAELLGIFFRSIFCASLKKNKSKRVLGTTNSVSDSEILGINFMFGLKMRVFLGERDMKKSFFRPSSPKPLFHFRVPSLELVSLFP
jgi:hypothetical protein